MEITAITELVDRLETERDEARLAVEEARGAVYRKGAPEDGNRQAWAEYEALVSGVVRAIAAETPVKNKLTVAAELEQALKESRWTDVGTWAAKLADLEPDALADATRPGQTSYVIRYDAHTAGKLVYWVDEDTRATEKLAAATRFPTPEAAARKVPSVWFSPVGEQRFTILEVTD